MPLDQQGTEAEAASALRAAARFGPYFTWEPWDGGPGWRPLRDLLHADVVADRVAAGRRALTKLTGLSPDDLGERVVASIVFLGLASRLLSPLLASAAVAGVLPVPDFERLRWRPVDAGPMPIAFAGLDAIRAKHDTAAIAHELTRTAVHDVVAPVLAVFGKRFAVSPKVLWGNVASALSGAAGLIADSSPAHAEASAAIVERALTVPPLLGSATLTRPDPHRPRWFLVRHNCCLYYRIPGGGMCGDCVLTPEAARRRQWRALLTAESR